MSGPSFRVVRLDGPERLPEALTVIHDVFGHYEGNLVPPSAALKETVDSIGRRLAGGAVFLAEDAGGRVIGAVCADRKGDAMYLGRLAVRPECQGRGVGAALVAAVERFAAEAGADRITIGVRLALADNIRMFQKLGFVETGRTAHPGFSEPTSMDLAKPVAR